MAVTTTTGDDRTLRDIAAELGEALDHVERITGLPLGYLELPAVASKLDRIASSIAEIEFAVPDEYAGRLDMDLHQIRSDFRRLAATLMDAANGINA